MIAEADGGAREGFPLAAMSVADFHDRTRQAAEAVRRHHNALLHIVPVFDHFRTGIVPCGFVGKISFGDISAVFARHLKRCVTDQNSFAALNLSGLSFEVARHETVPEQFPTMDRLLRGSCVAISREGPS